MSSLPCVATPTPPWPFTSPSRLHAGFELPSILSLSFAYGGIELVEEGPGGLSGMLSTNISLPIKARLALRTNETPVGCVLVYKGRIIAKGMNATHVTRNGTRHAELMALTALLSYSDPAATEACLLYKSPSPRDYART